MEFTRITSLQRMTYTKVAIALWNVKDVKSLIADFPSPLSMKKRKEKMLRWLKLENEVRGKVSKLRLPKLIKTKLLCFIGPIGLEMDIVHSNSYLINRELRDVFWTPVGTVDCKQMGEQLMQDENISSPHRFEVACAFCFEDYIHQLWQQLPHDPYKSLTFLINNTLVSFWSHFLVGRLAEFDNTRKRNNANNDMTLYEFLFWTSAEDGNELASRHFFQKLTSESKEKILVKAAIHVAKRSCSTAVITSGHPTNVLFFIFSVMNEEQQLEVFRSELRCVLSHLFEWPWQDLFLKMSRQIWSILTPKDYHYLLTRLIEEIRSRSKDYDYQMLFRLVWQQIPSACKKEVINLCTGRSPLIKLFEIKDKRNIKLFLEDAIISLKGIAYKGVGRRIYETLMHHEMWDLFRFFVEKCSLSKESLMKFKEQIIKNVHKKRGKGQNYVLDKPVEIIEEKIQQFCKRKSKEETSQPKKRSRKV